MRTESKNPYRWQHRNASHARGELSHERRWERKADFLVMPGAGPDGRNRAITRAFRSNTGPRPLYSRVAPLFEQIGWFPEFRKYTHPRSARA